MMKWGSSVPLFTTILEKIYDLFNSNLSSHTSTLVWGTVETVCPFLTQGNTKTLTRSIQKILFTHRDFRCINTTRNLILIKNNIVWEPSIVFEHNFLSSTD
ncbi:unnamed protein product [Lupinus luteus]|uniref:Uncharacterized protein n=1 Tax=Lupinus luteus TaxID=3873 RepID=A0AAV1W203_LUPLU